MKKSGEAEASDTRGVRVAGWEADHAPSLPVSGQNSLNEIQYSSSGLERSDKNQRSGALRRLLFGNQKNSRKIQPDSPPVVFAAVRRCRDQRIFHAILAEDHLQL